MRIYSDTVPNIMEKEFSIKRKQSQAGLQSGISFSAKQIAQEDTNNINNKGRTNVITLVRVVTLDKRMASSL